MAPEAKLAKGLNWLDSVLVASESKSELVNKRANTKL